MTLDESLYEKAYTRVPIRRHWNSFRHYSDIDSIMINVHLLILIEALLVSSSGFVHRSMSHRRKSSWHAGKRGLQDYRVFDVTAVLIRPGLFHQSCSSVCVDIHYKLWRFLPSCGADWMGLCDLDGRGASGKRSRGREIRCHWLLLSSESWWQLCDLLMAVRDYWNRQCVPVIGGREFKQLLSTLTTSF